MFNSFLSLLVGIISTIVLWMSTRFPAWSFFIPIFIVWLVLLTAAYFYNRGPGSKPKTDLPIFFVTAFGLMAILLMTEWGWSRYLIFVLGGILMAFLSFQHSNRKTSALTFELKPARRIMTMIWVFDLYAVICLAFSINIFFPDFYFWIVNLAASGAVAWISAEIWRLYFTSTAVSLRIWAFALALMMWEVIWVAHFLPFGYFVLGAMVTWVWYILLILIRFRLTSQGIIWKKQLWFLVFNGILFCTVLFLFIRWI